jgi:hypothetical protein
MNTKITRRGVIQVAGISAGLGALGAGLPGEALAQQSATPAQAAIEPNTIKRRGTGFHGVGG